MKVRYSLISLAFLMLAARCSFDEPEKSIHIFPYTFNFSESDYGWSHGFADYPAGPDDSVFFELKHAYTQKPGGDNAIMLSGNNHSDDLFMYIKKKLTGLEPSTDFTLTFDVELASDAPRATSGTGSSPGENVFLKVGATGIEPKSVIEKGNFVMNIDKGIQRQDGEDMIFIGDVATDESASGFVIISRSNSSNAYRTPLVVRSNSKGEIWLIVGTDSAFEGTTTLFYTKINVILSSPR
jgi:hypothetical protein